MKYIALLALHAPFVLQMYSILNTRVSKQSCSEVVENGDVHD